jgi:hypothetical protein
MEYRIRWEGTFSLNDLYSSGHWRTRKNLKDKWGLVFKVAIKAAKVQAVEKYEIEIRYNNARMDVSNAAGMLKIFEDTLRSEGLIKDDSPKYCKRVLMEYDSGLPKRSCEVVLREVE